VNALVAAHILAQARLRRATMHAAGFAWTALPSYQDNVVDDWVSNVSSVMAIAQDRAAALTEAFLARRLGRQPLGVNRALVTGPAVRGGVPLEEVHRRPFVTVWSALQAGTDWDDAVAKGLARVTSTAATDVQLSMRATLRSVGEQDDLILGYRRVPDGDACTFCQTVSGQRYHTSQLMPIHSHCGCGVDVITGAERPDFSGRLDNDRVAVREHGELGPVLGDPAHHFETL
jgi:hypothetical protein